MRAFGLACLFLSGCYLSHERAADLDCSDGVTLENVDASRTIPIGDEALVGRFRMQNRGGVPEGIITAWVTFDGLFSFSEPARVRVLLGTDAPEHPLFEGEVSGPGEVLPIMATPLPAAVAPEEYLDLFVLVDSAGLMHGSQMQVLLTGVLYGDPLAPERTCGASVEGPTMTFVTVGECVLGETRSCYSGPEGTDGVGRCHGSEHTCVLGEDGIPVWDQAPPDCVGEVTPYPWGDLLTGDGIGVDDDCDGEVDEFDFYFCGEFPGTSMPVELFGNTGCCTDAAFPSSTEVPPAGTLIKGSMRTVYYLAADGRRHVFATTNILSSWYHEPSFATISRGDDGPVVCPQVVQLPDELLAEIPVSSANVTFRPGWVTTGVTSVPDVRYVVTQGAILREVRVDLRPTELLCSVRVDDHLFTPDFLFGSYTVGAPITSLGDYDACAEADTTLEEELARRRP